MTHATFFLITTKNAAKALTHHATVEQIKIRSSSHRFPLAPAGPVLSQRTLMSRPISSTRNLRIRKSATSAPCVSSRHPG